MLRKKKKSKVLRPIDQPLDMRSFIEANNQHQSQQAIMNNQITNPHYLGDLEQQNLTHSDVTNFPPADTSQQRWVQQQNPYSPRQVVPTPQPLPNPYLYTRNPLTIAEANHLLAKPIAREIIAEKLRSLTILLLGLGGLLTTIFFIILHFQIGSNSSVIGIPASSIPNFWLMLVCCILSFGLFAWGVLNMRQIVHESQTYLEQCRQGFNTLPQFILTNFKRMVRRAVIWNWICIPSYLILAVVLGMLIWLNTYTGHTFSFAFWSFGVIPSLDSEIITVAIVSASLLFLHVLNGILVKKRKINIIGYFGSEVMNNDQVRDISKRTNRVCLACFILFMVVIFFVISVPLLLFRKKKGKGFKLPWQIL